MITLTNAHGTFTTTPAGLDAEIAYRLPNSVASLRAALTERTSLNYRDVHEVSALLIMFADMDYPACACNASPDTCIEHGMNARTV
jgi:hypothetical protein